MKRITLKDVARATFWTRLILDGKCSFCHEKIGTYTKDESEKQSQHKYILWHLREEHPDIAYEEETL